MIWSQISSQLEIWSLQLFRVIFCYQEKKIFRVIFAKNYFFFLHDISLCPTTFFFFFSWISHHNLMYNFCQIFIGLILVSHFSLLFFVSELFLIFHALVYPQQAKHTVKHINIWKKKEHSAIIFNSLEYSLPSLI